VTPALGMIMKTTFMVTRKTWSTTLTMKTGLLGAAVEPRWAMTSTLDVSSIDIHQVMFERPSKQVLWS
jgi:hypothetical protein